ncbi:calmodulin-binding protein 60 C-like isoform X2 [Typha latifolia]|uniref:calmodulin-binding protein 60 C-like isoform X2 n=1 Tax=Typha latifolia TaxID=4733 RepID=UPI003C2B76D8
MALGNEKDPYQPVAKRMKSMPSFSLVIKEVMITETARKISSMLEPKLRILVKDELERAFDRYFSQLSHRPTQLRIKEIESTPNLMLAFVNLPSEVVFTGNRIVDSKNKSLQIQLMYNEAGDSSTMYSGPPSKVEIVVLDGDFDPKDHQNWSSDEFDSKIVKPREGKRPLLVGKSIAVTLNTTSVSVEDIMFTDNSSWIRSGRFCLGARVCEGPRMKEAVTKSFTVKDQRGESYMKHYPPSPSDDVWRLMNISKGGKIHKRLEEARIQTVDDFLNLSISNRHRLRKILRMSDKAFEKTLEHATTCTIGETLASMHQRANVEQVGPLLQQQLDNFRTFHGLPLNGNNYSLPVEGFCWQPNHYDEATSSGHQNGGPAEVEVESFSMSPFLGVSLDDI